MSGYNPSYFDNVEIYEGFPIVSSDSTSLTLKKSYWEGIQNNIYRIGQRITMAIGTDQEETNTITDISEN